MTRGRIHKPGCWAAAWLLFAAQLALSASGSTVPLPLHDGQQRNGVATCASARCHDAERPWQNSKILQNEYRTWIEFSTHAESYEVLSSPLGKRIGSFLGIDPTRADQCLDCHTDNVPVSLRGKDFRLEDGVGCEACHGGSKPWLENHVSMSGTREDYLRAGLYPTEFPEPRAKLCLGCHLGTGERFVDHRLLAAGHPRLAFELDTFFFNMPLHHRDDADYRFRKSPPANAQFWTTGQRIAARQWLMLFDDDRHRMAGIQPEPAFQDCHACHRMYGYGRGSAQLRSPLVLNLSGLRMVDVIWPNAGFGQGVRSLEVSVSKDLSSVRQAARDLLARIDAVDKAGTSFSTGDFHRMFAELLRRAGADRYTTYLDAEQAVMGLAALSRTLDPEGQLAVELDALFVATEDDQKFERRRFVAAAKALFDRYNSLNPGRR